MRIEATSARTLCLCASLALAQGAAAAPPELKLSIEGAPQVVFKGDLSLVGPRPHAVNAKAADRQYDEVVDGYFARHRVKPGITGWAQVNGWRGETDTPEKIQQRVEHDLYYIENWSIMLDLYILVMTPFSLFTKSENAY